MSQAETQRVLEAYAASHDTSLIAPGAVFTDIATGDQHVGRPAIAALLRQVYHVAFDAHAELVDLTFGDGKATLEANIVGRHTGEFAGVPATGAAVRIPLVVCYDIADGMIQQARIYLLVAAFLEQVAGTGTRASATEVVRSA